MPVKRTTFKQRSRRTEQKQRHKVASELRKRMRVGRRNLNRYDTIDSGTRSMDEIVSEISGGTAIASQEISLDPRELTNLLLRPAPQPASAPTPPVAAAVAKRTGSAAAVATRRVLPSAPLPADDPAALPDTRLIEEEERKRREAEAAAAAAQIANKNHYRHHGQPYMFWQRVGLHPLLLKALRAMHFTHPTPVQEEVLPSVFEEEAGGAGSGSGAESGKKRRQKGLANRQKDVVVSAETGSGKTLVFALPILNDILRQLDAKGEGTATTTTTSTDAKTTEGRSTTETGSSDAGTVTKKSGKRKRAREDAPTDTVKPSSQTVGTTKSKKGNVTAAESEEETVTKTATSPATGRDEDSFRRRVMHSLIISPTRELALQINEAMQKLTAFAPHVTIGCVVGGMAAEKQQRVLNRHPHVLICTPGRLWQLVQTNEGCYLGHSISRRLHYVVLDEADKMLQSGRFEELKHMLERIHGEILPAGFVQEREEGAEAGEMEVEAGRWDEEKQAFIPFTAEEKAAAAEGRGKKKKGAAGSAKAGAKKSSRKRAHVDDEEDEENDDEDAMDDETATSGEAKPRKKKDEPRPIPMPAEPSPDHRVITYVTSATLSLQTNYERKDFKSNKSIIRTSNADVMGKVLQELDVKPSSAQVFTVTPQADVATKITETYLRCPDDSKDLYLYYFLKTFNDDRAIVFVNAISMLRRLVKILEALGIAVVGLHAAMQQRQRLKFIDKFKSGSIRVLVATDVASRGLDIDGLRYVVHYQVPRSTDAYIHRCGRTARCGGTGFSLLLVNAQEHMSFRKLLESLGRSESEMETFALQPTVVHQLHAHLRIALQIDKLQREIDKTRAKNLWVTRMSNEVEIEADDMIDDEAESENRAKAKAIKVLKRELDLLLKKFTGSYGGKGAFRTGAQALGAQEAEQKWRERAERQTLQKK